MLGVSKLVFSASEGLFHLFFEPNPKVGLGNMGIQQRNNLISSWFNESFSSFIQLTLSLFIN